MFTVEFSSSSDDELERELIRQRRRDDCEEKHIVRAASAHTPLAPQMVVLPSGRKVEVRKGTIYIPVRDIYVHTIDAKRHPSWFFGDGGLRRHRRPPVAPECVYLYPVRGAKHQSCGSMPAPLLCSADFADAEVVSLRDSSNADFLIFKEVSHRGRPSSARAINEEAEEEVAEASACVVTSDDNISDTVINTHPVTRRHKHVDTACVPNLEEEAADVSIDSALQRVSQRPTVPAFCPFNRGLTPFASLTTQHETGHRLGLLCSQSWATENRRVPVHAQHALFTRDGCDQVFFYNGLARSVGRFWCEPEDDVLHTEVVQQLDGVVPQKDLIGVAAFESRSLVGHTLVGRHFVTSALQSAGAPADPELSHRLHVFKGAVSTDAAYACWCPYRRTPLPSLAVSADNDLFECTMRPSDGVWERRHVRRFVNTPPTALCTIGWRATSTGQAPAALLSGMRNGTIQLTPLQSTSSRTGGGFFDATPRHASASVVAMHALPDREFDVVSVASSGEAKLWDVRYLTGNRDPVLHLCGPKVDAGTVADFHGHFVAIATRTGSLVCVDALTGTTLADIQEDMPENPDRCCVVQMESEYQVYLLKDRRVHRVVLTPS